MKKKCKSCPYFSFENIELLKEILKWTRFLALNKEHLETEKEKKLVLEIKRLNRFLPLYIQSNCVEETDRKVKKDEKQC